MDVVPFSEIMKFLVCNGHHRGARLNDLAAVRPIRLPSRSRQPVRAGAAFFHVGARCPGNHRKTVGFAKSGYLDNSMPAVFKERLFVYLSRFCEVRYCIIRHCAFLLGYGHSAGDPSAAPQTVEQAIRLLRTPTPWERKR